MCGFELEGCLEFGEGLLNARMTPRRNKDAETGMPIPITTSNARSDVPIMDASLPQRTDPLAARAGAVRED